MHLCQYTPDLSKMLNRLLKLPPSQNILLFGPRGVGKSTLLKTAFHAEKTCYPWQAGIKHFFI